MAVAALPIAGGNVVWWLPSGHHIVMTRATSPHYKIVVHGFHWRPAQSALVTHTTVIRRDIDVIGRLAGDLHIVMTANASGDQVFMAEISRYPTHIRVALSAVQGAGYVIWRLTGDLLIIVALDTGPHHLHVIHAHYVFPKSGAVAGGALIGTGDVGNRFKGRIKAGVGTMAAHTIVRGTFELSVSVAALAGHERVRALQRKAGIVMIKGFTRSRTLRPGASSHQNQS